MIFVSVLIRVLNNKGKLLYIPAKVTFTLLLSSSAVSQHNCILSILYTHFQKVKQKTHIKNKLWALTSNHPQNVWLFKNYWMKITLLVAVVVNGLFFPLLLFKTYGNALVVCLGTKRRKKKSQKIIIIYIN